MKTPAKKSGFTLIEIVIVLAIAALIMVIVFVAVAGAQRSRRDTTAKANANTLLAQAVQWYANNGGSSTAWITSNLPVLKNLPAGQTVNQIGASKAASSITAAGTIYIGPGTCNGGGITYSTGVGSFAAAYFSEVSGSAVCQASE